MWLYYVIISKFFVLAIVTVQQFKLFKKKFRELWSVIKRPTDSTTSTKSGQTDITSGQTSTINGQTNGQTSTTSEKTSTARRQTSTTSTTGGQGSTTSDQTSYANTSSNKMGFAIIITLC